MSEACFECGGPAVGEYAPVPGGNRKVKLCSACMVRVRHDHARRGRPPYGFVVDGGQLLPVEAEQAVIAKIEDLSLDGCNDGEVARALNEQGLRTRVGAQWTHVAVHRVLVRLKRDRAARP